MTDRPRTTRQPACPIRRGDPCSLCEPGVEGPHDCGLVYLVMSDPELKEMYREQLERRDGLRGSGAPG